MNEKLDFKKEYPALYLPKGEPSLVTVPPIGYLMVDGTGAPEGEDYQQAIQTLYALSFTIKMSRLAGKAPAGYFEYVVPPLEGLWEGGALEPGSDRRAWSWTSMIRQPDFVNEEVFAWAVGKAKTKKPDVPVERARFAVYDEGDCAQLMHVGPYREEGASIARLTAFIAANGLADDCSPRRRHHEIYLSDPRRTAPEKCKTVLRHPVRRL